MGPNNRGTINNHYVPQFILRNFGDRINIFNIRTQGYSPNRNPKSIFCRKGIYSDKLESKLNNKLEVLTADLINKKILNTKGDITLTRKELLLLKRFFVIGMLRSPDAISMVRQFRSESEAIAFEKMMFDPKGRYSSDYVEGESDEEYWERTMGAILDADDYNLGTISNNPKSTFLAYYWTIVYTSGYIAIWDAPEEDDFIITDIGMTSEIELRDNPADEIEGRKIKTLMAWHDLFETMASDGDEMAHHKAEEIDLITVWQAGFKENFYMFPLSSKRMIVLVNPFFKQYFSLKDTFGDLLPPLWRYTAMPDERVFAPNRSERMLNDTGPRKPSDRYTYTPVSLWREEIQYCNALQMDRVHTWLGFGSLERARGSIVTYGCVDHPRNDYSGLFDVIYERNENHH